MFFGRYIFLVLTKPGLLFNYKSAFVVTITHSLLYSFTPSLHYFSCNRGWSGNVWEVGGAGAGSAAGVGWGLGDHEAEA